MLIPLATLRQQEAAARAAELQNEAARNWRSAYDAQNAYRGKSAYQEFRRHMTRESAAYQDLYGDKYCGIRDGRPIVLGETNVPTVRRDQ